MCFIDDEKIEILLCVSHIVWSEDTRVIEVWGLLEDGDHGASQGLLWYDESDREIVQAISGFLSEEPGEDRIGIDVIKRVVVLDVAEEFDEVDRDDRLPGSGIALDDDCLLYTSPSPRDRG